MEVIGLILFTVIHVLICGFLGAKCQPIYKKNSSRCKMTPGESDIKQIMRICKNEKAADACEKIYSMAVNDYAWWTSALSYESISKVPVGYVLCVINAFSAAASKGGSLIFAIILAVLDIAACLFFANIYKEEDLRAIEFNVYHLSCDASADDYLEGLQSALNKNVGAVRHRCEIMQRLTKDANDYRALYLLFTAMFVCARLYN